MPDINNLNDSTCEVPIETPTNCDCDCLDPNSREILNFADAPIIDRFFVGADETSPNICDVDDHIKDNDNPHEVKWDQTGAAQASHSHNASDINAGTLGINRIPTGNTQNHVCIGNDTRLSNARTPTAHTHALGTGANQVNAAPVSHTHNASSITAGTFGTGRTFVFSDSGSDVGIRFNSTGGTDRPSYLIRRMINGRGLVLHRSITVANVSFSPAADNAWDLGSTGHNGEGTSTSNMFWRTVYAVGGVNRSTIESKDSVQKISETKPSTRKDSNKIYKIKGYENPELLNIDDVAGFNKLISENLYTYNFKKPKQLAQTRINEQTGEEEEYFIDNPETNVVESADIQLGTIVENIEHHPVFDYVGFREEDGKATGIKMPALTYVPILTAQKAMDEISILKEQVSNMQKEIDDLKSKKGM